MSSGISGRDGWDDPSVLLHDFAPSQGGAKESEWGSDPWAKAWRPDWGEGGNPLRTRGGTPRIRTMEFKVGRDEGEIVPLSGGATGTADNGAASAASAVGQTETVSEEGADESHGKGSDQEKAISPEGKALRDRIDNFTREYNAYVARMQIQGKIPASEEKKWAEYQKNGSIDQQWLGSGQKLEIVEKIKSYVPMLKAAGFDEKAAELEKVAAEMEEQAKAAPDWREDAALYDLMKTVVKLGNMWQKAKEIPVKKDPLGEGKFWEMIKGRFGL